MLNIDKKIIEFLQDLGLSSTEQKLYLTGLQMPEAEVTNLIQETEINRTTAYHALGTLRQKGLASEIKSQGKLVYTMVKPEDLEKYLSRKKAAIEKQKQQLVELADLFPSAISEKSSSYVEKFEGIEGVKNAVEKALYCKSREWKIIAPKSNFFSQMERSYARYFMETRRSQKIKARSLWEEKFSSGSKLSLADLLARKPRYLPKHFTGKFRSVIIIFDDKALFISSASNPSAILVHSSEIIETLEVLFEGLWATAQKPSLKD